MIFNSLEFLLFLLITFTLYWSVFKKTAIGQNILLLIASYFFYGWWNMKLLALLIVLNTITYYIGLFISNTENDRKRKYLMYGHVLINILILCFFKYFNFFYNSIIQSHTATSTYNIVKILFPLGLSFYTFKNLSYILDIYKRKIEPTKNYLNFSLYISFFPCIVSGPIDKPKVFLQQIANKRVFNNNTFTDSINLILLGFFKKIIIADSIATFVDNIFNKSGQYNSAYVFFGVILYSFQIYADFSGYSDLAKGIAGLFGINIVANFNFPFFSKNIAEFWRRWHISLSTWLNDYVFNPLAIEFRYWGSHGIYLAIVITFIISGIWHGEGFTFLIWGLLHALYYSPIIYSNKQFTGISTPNSSSNNLLNYKAIPKILWTFILVTFALIFFRSNTVSQAFSILQQIGKFDFSNQVLSFANIDSIQLYKGLVGIVILFIYDYIMYNSIKIANPLDFIFKGKLSIYGRIVLYSFIFWALILWGGEGNKTFIYVQF